jgi:hypothetical protein
MVFNSFDPYDKSHVEWLKRIIDAPVEDKHEIFLQNPMHESAPAFEMIQIIFGLSMKYTKAVFSHTAYILEDS